MDAPGSDCCESFEICIFRFIEIFPVIITFTLLIILSIFYVFVSYSFITNFFKCYLKPTLEGDFESSLGLPDYWANDTEKENDKKAALIILIIFIILITNLFLAILLTIFTDPGQIP